MIFRRLFPPTVEETHRDKEAHTRLQLIAKWDEDAHPGDEGGEFTVRAAVSNDASRTASFVEGDSIGEVLNGVPFSLS